MACLHTGAPAPQPLGPLKQLAVQQGDTVTVTAPGLYPQATEHNFWFSLASFLTGLLQPAPSLPAPPDAVRRGGLPLLQVGVAAGLASVPQLSGGVPKGYVRLLVFDADSNLVSQQTQQLSAAALNNYERLRLQVVVPQDGYVTAYVGNESNVDIFFDDVSVEHRQGLQLQETQYDPWGVTLVGINHLGNLPENKYQFNGKEQERELGLNWQDFNWRHYDPATARFFGVDRLAEKFVYLTDYQFASNNPTSKIELDGLEGISPEAILWGQTPFYTTGPSDDPHRDKHNIEVSKQIGMETLKEIGKQALMLVAGEVLGIALRGLAVGAELAGAGGQAVRVGETAASRAGAESVAQGGELSNGARMVEQPLAPSTGASPNVRKALNTIDDIKKSGGTIEPNALRPNQEMNMTIKNPDGSKLDMRIETDVVSKKYGGNGTTPQRHLNADVYNSNGNRVKMDHINRGHKVL